MFPTAEVVMAKSEYSPAKVTPEALRIARIVAAYRGTTLAEYISAIIFDQATKDLAVEQEKASAKPPKTPKR